MTILPVPDKAQPKKRTLVNAAKVVAVSALAAGSLAMAMPSAMASGSSGSTNGRYARWWNTAFAGYCTPATAAGQYELVGVCDYQVDYYGPWRYIGRNSYISPFDSSACRFSVSRSWVQYTNG